MKYNEQKDGYQGLSLSGRWLWKPLNDQHTTFQFGTVHATSVSMVVKLSRTVF